MLLAACYTAPGYESHSFRHYGPVATAAHAPSLSYSHAPSLSYSHAPSLSYSHAPAAIAHAPVEVEYHVSLFN
jgi:hypothetical protein